MDYQEIQIQGLWNLIEKSRAMMSVPFEKEIKEEFDLLVFNLNELEKITTPTKNFLTDSKALKITIDDYLKEMKEIYPEYF